MLIIAYFNPPKGIIETLKQQGLMMALDKIKFKCVIFESEREEFADITNSIFFFDSKKALFQEGDIVSETMDEDMEDITLFANKGNSDSLQEFLKKRKIPFSVYTVEDDNLDYVLEEYLFDGESTTSFDVLNGKVVCDASILEETIGLLENDMEMQALILLNNKLKRRSLTGLSRLSVPVGDKKEE